MKDPLRILVLEDSAADVELMEGELKKAGIDFVSQAVEKRADFARALQDAPPDLVLADYALPNFNGLEALKLVRGQNPELPFILVSGSIDGEHAVEIMLQGATDLVSKSHLKRLAPAIQRALRERDEQRDKRRAEGLLRESEARFRAVFEGGGNGIAIEDLQGKIIQTNRALQQMLGYPAEELRQITRKDFTHTQDHKEETSQFKRLLAGSADHYQVEKRFVRRDGRIFWGRLTVSMVRDTAGRPQFPMVMIEDITERQRAEEAHLRYAAIVESSNDAIVSLTLDGIIYSWNPAAARLFGYTPPEANGRPDSLIIPPDKEAEAAQVLEKIKRGASVDNLETTRVRKDGQLIHVSVATSPIQDLSGRTIGASSFYRDITERKQAETALRESEENYRKLVESSPDAVFIHSEGKHVYLNAAGFRLFGAAKPEDIIGRPVLDFVHPDFHRVVKERIRQLSAGRQAVPLMEQKIIRVDGATVDVEAIAIAFVYRGQPAVQVIARDISERKRAEEALRQSEAENQKLAAFAQFNPNPVFELAGDGALDYFNEAAQQMARSLGKQQPAEMLPPDTAAMVKECLLTGRSRLRHETIIQARVISWSLFPIPAIGVVHCYAADTTEHKSLEAQLRQAQKMESVGQLAGGIAHDFNNILTVIQGHTSLLGMFEIPDQARESAQQISFAAERAANLTRQLLTFSRRQIMQPKNLDLNEVVSHMTKMLRRLLGEDITLQVNFAPNLPALHADPGMMEQILMNLAVNSRDAMPKGGSLLIETSPAKIDDDRARQTHGATPGDYVCLAVTDTGKGIPPEVLPHIFEPFFTTKDVGKGTGLGLATVYGIVRQHHGFLNVSSKVNEGAVFQIFLPALAVKAAAQKTAVKEPEVRGGSETILVVEDEPPLRGLVRSVLHRYGYNVLEADSGVDALPIWLEHRDHISLLLTDMVMPHGVSGRELAERLHGDKPELKVIYSSGYSLAVVGADMVLQEGLNFLQKPYSPRKLAQAVRDCLDK